MRDSFQYLTINILHINKEGIIHLNKKQKV